MYFDGADRRRLVSEYKTWKGLPLGAYAETIAHDTGLMMSAMGIISLVAIYPGRFEKLRRQLSQGNLDGLFRYFNCPEDTAAGSVFAEKDHPSWPYPVLSSRLRQAENQARGAAKDAGASPEEIDAAGQVAWNQAMEAERDLLPAALAVSWQKAEGLGA
jgi:hypothetical protein